MIEAELSAAERYRPALSGRALLCAAVHARSIQGLTASQKLPDARNRAPVTPVSLRDRRESQRKGGFGGVKRGQGNHTVPLPPFALRRGHGVPPPVNTGSPGRRRRPLCTLTLSVNLACGGKPPERRNRSPSTEGKNHGAPPTRRRVCLLLPIGLLRIYKAFYKGFS